MRNQQFRSAGIRSDALDDRALRLGSYIAEHGATVRSTAAVFGISKSTVHKDITVRLPQLPRRTCHKTEIRTGKIMPEKQRVPHGMTVPRTKKRKN